MNIKVDNTDIFFTGMHSISNNAHNIIVDDSNCEPLVKKYKCLICAKSFLDLSHLRRHSVVHTGEKPFVCSVCQKGFSQSSSLKIHQRLHTGERPFKCHLCDYSAPVSSNLKSHIFRKHRL